MSKITFTFLGDAEIAKLAPPMGTVLDLVEGGLRAHGEGRVVLPPKAHLFMPDRYAGHFNILPGYVEGAQGAGVKIVGDFVYNYRHGLPSEVAVLLMLDPETGVPRGLLDATLTTWMRTGAVTGIGAKYLARPGSRIVAHLGARGSAFYNLAALAQLFPLDDIRIVSKRPESCDRLVERVRRELGIACRGTDTVDAAAEGADIVVEATRLERPEALLRDAAVAPGALVVTYGWQMALEPALTLGAGKIVVDDWAQCQKGGALHPLIQSGELTADRIHGEIGEIIAGRKPGRESAEERIVFWHRGFAISDIVLGHWLLGEAERRGIGTRLTLRAAREE